MIKINYYHHCFQWIDLIFIVFVDHSKFISQKCQNKTYSTVSSQRNDIKS